MLHKILNVEGVEVLKKDEQKKVKGGVALCGFSICVHWDILVFKPNCVCE